jgi:peptide/nickel transport system substrate-binding protein
MDSVEAPDPLTLVVHWSSVYTEADRAFGLIPLPRHLMESTYRNDKANFLNSPLLGPEFVGLGPYRLVRWEPGVQMEFTRFDQYYMGRPPLDTVTLKFIGDPNGMVASILSGSADVVLPLGVDVQVAEELKQRWAGTGNQVWGTVTGAMRYILIQHRPEYSRPQNGLTQRVVRQGVFNATDRQAVAEVATMGYSPAMDGWFPPTHELAPQVQSAVPQYPHDLSLAQQRLQQGGWVRNAQGELMHQQTGERFEIELRSFQEGPAEKNLATIADAWQGVGIRTAQYVVPGALNSDPEYRNTLPGAGITGQIWDMMYTNALDSRLVAGPTNRWNGSNRAGYTNPAVDTLYDRLANTISPQERLAVHRALLQEVFTDVAYIPLYWEYSPVLALKGVHNVGSLVDNSNTWNMFQWTKD